MWAATPSATTGLSPGGWSRSRPTPTRVGGQGPRRGWLCLHLTGRAMHRPRWSTLLGGRRSPATCRNPGPHSGKRKIHGKDGLLGLVRRATPWGARHPRAARAGQGSSRYMMARSEHLTLPLTVTIELRKRRSAQRWAGPYSHGGSQGFKSPHLHPTKALVTGLAGRFRRAGAVPHPPTGQQPGSNRERKRPTVARSRPR
jgi:hypothetical protein